MWYRFTVYHSQLYCHVKVLDLDSRKKARHIKPAIVTLVVSVKTLPIITIVILLSFIIIYFMHKFDMTYRQLGIIYYVVIMLHKMRNSQKKSTHYMQRKIVYRCKKTSDLLIFFSQYNMNSTSNLLHYIFLISCKCVFSKILQ